ncbi:MAG: nuclear transport factor 2 family protein [Dehalococcoidia bacterium]|jgi:ketosteroid isomerase-like protein
MEIQAAQELCNRWLPAWTGNCPDKLIEFYAADAFYSDPVRREGLRGHAQILPYFERLLAQNPQWKWEAVELFPTDKGFTGKWKATIPAGNTTVIEYGVDIVEVADGKITRNEVYFDRVALLKAVGTK